MLVISGPNCEEPVYDCKVHACQGGGTCVPNGEYNYTCRCRPNYFGTYCELHTGKYAICSFIVIQV